ncbi:DUF4238 domain-containing protein [Mycobacterium marinum]|uniref:DUF4238 domain-containing protein n=1 Tax=Mycobacterium marinum TaxID=1781 RepID=UPI00233F8415|nr:DUF4238 domain-containing protein [Mycobacterium marinum]MDC8992414.1 DUF4238 domain-containing protein [Mycobacterium marinum]WDZ15721.1 DUF4238 domain-containing protein [Mycobacterium marinum]
MLSHRWTSDAEIAESKRQTIDGAVGKRHHYVPQMYLRRWADGDGKVQLTKTVTGDSYIQSPEDIAKRTNLYTIAADDLEPDFPSRWLEKHMSRIESEAAGWLRALDDLSAGRMTDRDLIENLAVFVALQDQRTLRKHDQELRIEDALNRFGRAEVLSVFLPFVCWLYRIPYSRRRHGAILQQFLDRPLISSERKPRALESTVGVWRNQAVPHFAAQRTWWLIDSETPLLTCDEPVVHLGGSVRPRWRTSGWATSPVVLLPVGPHRLLVLTNVGRDLDPPFELDAMEAAQVNFEMVSASNEVCFERSDTNIAASIRVPPWPDADPASASTFMEAVLSPSRWKEGEGPPWAVSRWHQ